MGFQWRSRAFHKVFRSYRRVPGDFQGDPGGAMKHSMEFQGVKGTFKRNSEAFQLASRVFRGVARGIRDFILNSWVYQERLKEIQTHSVCLLRLSGAFQEYPREIQRISGGCRRFQGQARSKKILKSPETS